MDLVNVHRVHRLAQMSEGVGGEITYRAPLPVMADVAKAAGVSHQTVSRVLNQHPSVRAATRERVLEAVRQLNYRPNAMARGLAGRRSRVIGVVGFDTILYGPASTLLGIERAARAAGYGVSIVTLEQVDHSGMRRPGALADQSVAGVVVIAPQTAAAAPCTASRRGRGRRGVQVGGEIPASPSTRSGARWPPAPARPRPPEASGTWPARRLAGDARADRRLARPSKKPDRPPRR